MRVLLVEDEPNIRELIATLCAERGAGVEAVDDGARALGLARSGDFGLVLLDIVLPGLDGISVCRFLRADAATRELPVYMMSARTRDEDRQSALQAGASGFLEKPFRSEALFVLLDRHLRRG